MTSFRLRIMAQALPFLLVAPGLALAQAPPTRAESAAALHRGAQPGAVHYTRAQIDQLIAPIVLYPDHLLAQVLMAATYPQQIVEAAQWVQEPAHAALRGEALVTALEPLPWAPSVKALVVFPKLVVMLSEHVEWTQALGVAFVTEEKVVMTRVQALRTVAVKSGRLRKLRHLAVRHEGGEIVIASAQPDRVFVPVYNPTVVFGEWPDPDYPPVFIPPPPGFVAETVEPGFQVSVGHAVVAPLWGWSRPDWRAERITINRTQYTRITRNVEIGPGNTWEHRGPIVLAVRPEAAGPRTRAAAPSGTVAPAAAAAVVSLPQHAARHPDLIRTARPGATQPEQNRTAAGQPGTAQPNQTQRNGAQPNPAQNEAARPSTTQPGQATTAPTQRERAGTTTPTAEPANRAAGAAERAPANTGTTTREQATGAPEHHGRNTGTSTREQTTRSPEHHGPNSGTTTREQATGTPEHHDRNSGTAARGQATGSEHSGSVNGSAAHERGAGSAATREHKGAPERAGSTTAAPTGPAASSAPRGETAAGHRGEHSGASPTAIGQGSSTPSGNAAPHAVAPAEHSPAAGRSQESDQKEHKGH